MTVPSDRYLYWRCRRVRGHTIRPHHSHHNAPNCPTAVANLPQLGHLSVSIPLPFLQQWAPVACLFDTGCI